MDAVITYEAFKLWLEDVDDNLQRYVLWRYIATRNGVFRVYPATILPKAFDPTDTTWYVD